MPPVTITSSVARANHRVRDLDGANGGGAHLVDRVGADLFRDSRADRGLAGGRLADAGLQHLAHDHVLDLAGLEPGPLERGLDRDRAELGRLVGSQAAAELSERRAGSGNDDGSGHWQEPNGQAKPRKGRQPGMSACLALDRSCLDRRSASRIPHETRARPGAGQA